MCVVSTPYTKPTSASWGNTRYYGKNFDNFLMHNKVNPRYNFQYKHATTLKDVKEYANFYLFNKYEKVSSITGIEIKQKVGFTYYIGEDWTWYLQLLLYQYGRSFGTWIGGAMWLPVGNQIILSYD
ncbi:hypothetical protein [Spiroplasma phoeniceum]|uniref:Uncharacterized protein n=1 Tax=Spiroplasma phoeniceum P40 TaxID=1276259 RepID=A0A345DQ99_9MOLU|nr:hypothetical protein [Spiroplasma phoeniceum]AXF96390.1 hypothetical protein SDAV_001423 [Spiroplasma phoeniceum P40]